MLGQTPTGQVASTQHKFLSHGSGGWRHESGVPHGGVGGGPSSGPLTWWEGRRIRVPFTETGSVPLGSTLVTSLRPPGLTPSPWGLGFPARVLVWNIVSTGDTASQTRANGLRDPQRGAVENAVLSRVGGVLGRMGTGTRGRVPWSGHGLAAPWPRRGPGRKAPRQGPEMSLGRLLCSM